jgi:hypothetical protein
MPPSALKGTLICSQSIIIDKLVLLVMISYTTSHTRDLFPSISHSVNEEIPKHMEYPLIVPPGLIDHILTCRDTSTGRIICRFLPSSAHRVLWHYLAMETFDH